MTAVPPRLQAPHGALGLAPGARAALPCSRKLKPAPVLR